MARTEKDKMLAGELYDVSAPEYRWNWRQRIAGSRATTLHWTWPPLTGTRCYWNVPLSVQAAEHAAATRHRQ
jgi:hypothetical protein